MLLFLKLNSIQFHFEQNRNVPEQFASLVFTSIPQECQTEMSNGEQSEQSNDINVVDDVEESTTRSFSTESLVYISNPNKDLKDSIVTKEDFEQNDIIHQEYVFARKQGMNKKLFFKVINEIRNKRGIKNLGKYIRGAIQNVMKHVAFKKGQRTYDNSHLQTFYNLLNEVQQKNSVAKASNCLLYDWTEMQQTTSELISI
ncbi:hypothetical protein CN945_20180 [Bacillus thuringiensis]|nr:hypothetical protein CN945_20180 [Bacillus thuringiensis]